ncbi:MAG: LemA family protein [Patescibacteria group bacterium]|nr:LemA family protein [Patescibacteria group bacterium]
MNPALIALIVVGALLLLYIVGTYNGLIKRKVRCEEGWSDIDVQLKRRYNLIPNLIETVKGYATHEKEVFTEVTKARTAAMDNSGTPGEQAKTENMLTGALKSLFAVAENYPKLQANQNFLDLQQQLAETEDKIQASRRFYNGTVRDFNTALQVFPKNIIAGMFAFKKREFFEVENEEERKNVKVEF